MPAAVPYDIGITAITFFHTHAQPGDLISFRFAQGNAVPFITITDNTTNDPEVRLPDFAVAHSVLRITE